MLPNYLKATLRTAVLAVTILLLTAAVLSAQTVSLTASQQTTMLPDGTSVPMWGWTCGDSLTTPVLSVGATCTALTYNTASTTGAHNSQAGGTTWQPPLIVVPSMPVMGANLTITLTNTLPVETSIMIAGQVTAATQAGNGGLGTVVRESGPRTDGAHAPGGQTATTWTTVTPGSFIPPTQSARVRTFVGTEVAGVATVGATPATGTYTWTGLQPGTYLIRTGTYPSIQGPMGLYGVLVVTQAPTATAPGLAYPVAGSTAGGVTYDADVVALESEIDPRQNNMVAALFPTACTGAGAPVAACTAAGPLPTGAATANPGFSETAKWTPQCGALTLNALGVFVTSTGAIPTCY